ncbi:alpha/beta hydrolase [Demequina sp. NBRC 110057]|uniref:RBBP9/YdeN family alpha/beta hydrolase n=1 Tax=Demequina sp. NBRC 110057 TaxID=1570346 RepID=UPI001F225F20|nr:alpha/beta hydrolase [Demequina sp. NBRC 110057]
MSAVVFGEASAAARIVVVPGWGGSGEAHWQSLWQAAHPAASRTAPASWDEPDLEDWIAALDRAVAAGPDAPLLVAHSLGTYVSALWMALHPGRARGALLVAPPDPGRDGAADAIRGFARDSFDAVGEPAIAVASTDDPYGTLDHARWYASQVGAPLEVAGAYGHINADSGLGGWPQGLDLLERLALATHASDESP